MRSNSTANTTADRQWGLLGNVLVALLVGVAVGGVAATTGRLSGWGALGVVAGLMLGLGGLAAVPALLRLLW